MSRRQTQPIQPQDLEDQVYSAIKAAFSACMKLHPREQFYAFGLFTDDSLQFLHPVANSEEGLSETVADYRKTVDPKYGTTSTRNGMRWSYGDWKFFPDCDEKAFKKVNKTLSANFDRMMEDDTNDNTKELWAAILQAFQRVNKEGFFGTGPERARITLLPVGDLSEKLINKWVRALNPRDVAKRYLEWDSDAPDAEDIAPARRKR